ncbi:MAG: hypothetical protein MK207_14515, partial [Saprospiraceae bacterium]|nr:hypothetical protein [Saprospiraceae bacterium]
DYLFMSENGYGEILVGKTGNIGIGDASPDGKLEVRQTAAADIFNLYDNTTNVFTVQDGGNVGIGDAAPFQKMEIKGGTSTWDLGGNATDVDNLYLEDLSAADGIDAIGGSISFSGAGNGGGGVARRHAAIAGIQTSTDNDHVGLAFFTHNNATNTGDMQESMRITHNGRVQINGTTDASGIANTGVLEIANSLRLDDNEIITNTNTVLYINHNNNGDVYFDDGTLMVDASANEVGIGANTPDGKLEVRQTDTADIFNLYDDTTNVLTVRDGGNVGIGTNAPSATLHVKGEGTSNSTTSFLVEDSAGDDLVTVKDDGNVGIKGDLKINGTQVLTVQQALIPDLLITASLGDVITKVNQILAMLRTHGLIGT